MTPAAIRALASRVETEEPTDDLRAAVLTAFGSEAEPGLEPDPLVSVDDAKAFQPDRWRVYMLEQGGQTWTCMMQTVRQKQAGQPRLPSYEQATAYTEPCARTAANLRALAWEKENADA